MAMSRLFKRTPKMIPQTYEMEARSIALLVKLKKCDIITECKTLLAEYESICAAENQQPGLIGRNRVSEFKDIIKNMEGQTTVQAFHSLFRFYCHLPLQTSRLAKILDGYIARKTGVVSFLAIDPTKRQSLNEINRPTQIKRAKIIEACLVREQQLKRHGTEMVMISQSL